MSASDPGDAGPGEAPGEAGPDEGHGLGGPPVPAETQTGPSVIRSEDELVSRTEQVEIGRARLVKRVEVETVSRTIEVRREYLEVERLTGRDAGPGEMRQTISPPAGPFAPGAFEDGVMEVVLMQEEVELTTRVVPRERVNVRKHTVVEERVVDADLRREVVDLEAPED